MLRNLGEIIIGGINKKRLKPHNQSMFLPDNEQN